MNKSRIIVSLFLAMCFVGGYAQSKDDLKAEIEQLKQQNQMLMQMLQNQQNQQQQQNQQPVCP
ncbi:MAG: hypothetical protein PUB38_09990 [Prevotella sp.]|nr:hypothetical protein [Prevotella sp.]MDD6862883.1 hypothetical protein [Prevotella sp.]